MSRLNYIKNLSYLLIAFLWSLYFVCIVKQKIDQFESWSKENNFLPWTFLCFTLIILSWISYPQILNERIAKRDNIIESKPQLSNTTFPKTEEKEKLVSDEFSYKKLGEEYGTLGDTYGALNTLFTGLAFGGLILSIFLQMLELKATRKELAEQKEALIGQHKEFETQTGILTTQIKLIEKQKIIAENQSSIIVNQLIESRKQNFTSIFNALMEERRFKIQCFKIYTSGDDVDGLDVLRIYGINLIERFFNLPKNATFLVALQKFKSDANNSDVENAREIIRDYWNDFESNKNQYYVIGNYFSIIFSLFYLIEEYCDVLGPSYEFYIETVKRIINQHELITLFWVALGNPQYDELIYKYQLFERLSYVEGLGVLGKNIFRVEAFGDNKNWKECFDIN